LLKPRRQTAHSGLSNEALHLTFVGSEDVCLAGPRSSAANLFISNGGPPADFNGLITTHVFLLCRGAIRELEAVGVELEQGRAARV
jgi:hypothetical protein